jgi:FkbM family methyltransferase
MMRPVRIPRVSPEQRLKALRLARRPRLMSPLRYRVVPSLEHVWVPFGQVTTVLDVGASRGQFATLMRYLQPNARIVCFEPLPAALGTLSRVGARYGLEIHATALDERRGSAPLYVATSDDSSSMLPMTERMTSEFEGMGTASTTEVTTTRLDDLELDIGRPCLIKIDAQGSELRILRGARETLERVDEAYIECSFVELYEGQPLAADIVAFMLGAGFLIAGIHNVAHGRDGTQHQVDIHFRRIAQSPAPAIDR